MFIEHIVTKTRNFLDNTEHIYFGIMHIGQNIRLLRKRQGLTAEELAEKVSKTRNAITQYEIGRTTPPVETVMALSRYFNVKIDDLLNRDLSVDADEALEDVARSGGVVLDPQTALWDYRALVAKVRELEERLSLLTGVGK